MPATTDYWINDMAGDPVFVVTAEANAGMVKMLPTVLEQARALVGERRITIVFDRGGFSPKLFLRLIANGFDILTYRKGASPRVAKSRFSLREEVIDGRMLSYILADQEVRLIAGKLRLRQVTRLRDDHQTPVLTSRRDLSPVEVAFRMFERWRQENFFKYLREEYALRGSRKRPLCIDIGEEIRLTVEATQKVIDMADNLRKGLLAGDFVIKIREAQKKGDAQMVKALRDDALENIESNINFIKMMGGEDGLGAVQKKLEATKEYIIQKFSLK